MKQRIRIHPYKQGSRSASRLAEALGGKVLKREGSTFRRRATDVVINWGDSRAPDLSPARTLNSGASVALAANKLQTFVRLKEVGVNVPDFSSSKEAVGWDGATVARHKLSGHSGEGIELCDASALPSAPLYVRYVPKKDEFRVHVVGERVILVQRKARRPDCDNPNWKVRNHDNGFIFVRNDVEAPRGVEEQAVRAVASLGLDFGAADVIWNEKQQRAYVLEVNTAPGLEGQTILDYVNGFKGLINGIS